MPPLPGGDPPPSSAAFAPSEGLPGLRRAASVIDVATLAAVLGAYRPSLSGEYILDDRVYLSDNELLARIPASEPWRVFVQPTNPWEYLPVRDLSYLVDLHVGGLSPAFSHAFQLALYVLGCLAVRGLAARLLEGVGPGRRDPGVIALGASLAMAVFALHPSHAEAVAWVSGRKDVLSGLFVCLALSGVAGAARGPKVHGPMALASAAFVLSLLSKTTAAVTPIVAVAVLLASPRMRENPRELGRASPWLLLWFVLAAASVALASIVAEATGLASDGIAPGDRWLPLRILGRLVELVFVPYPLSLQHDVASPGALLLGGAVAAATPWFVARLLAGRATVVDLGFVLLVVPLVPVLQLVPFRTWSLASERFVFLAVLGPALVLGSVLAPRFAAKGTPRLSRWALAAMASLGLALATLRVHGRAAEMRSLRVLLRIEADRNPEDAGSLDVYVAEILLPERRYDEALARANRLPGSPSRTLLLAYVSAQRALASGDRAAMTRALRDLVAAGPTRPKPLRTIARLEEGLGHVDAALAAYYAASRADRHFVVDLEEARARLLPELELARRASASRPSDSAARLALVELCLRGYALEEADVELRSLLAAPLPPELEPRTQAALERLRRLTRP